MNNSIITAAMLTLAVAFIACNKSDNADEENIKTAVSFTTTVKEGIGEDYSSRVSNTAWSADDRIGVFMVKHDGTTISESAENKEYVTATGNGQFAPASPEHTIYFPMDDSAVDFIAYYPYKLGNTLTANINIDATDPTFDLLYATANNNGNGYNKSFGQKGEKVDFAFHHQMSKFIMNIKSNDAVGTINKMDVTIKGMKTRASFNLATGTFTDATAKDNFVPQTITALKSFSAFVIPSTYTAKDNLQIEFTINKNTKAETFIWTVDEDIEFVSGHYHTYTVTLNRTDMTATGSIVEWKDGGEGHIGIN